MNPHAVMKKEQRQCHQSHGIAVKKVGLTCLRGSGVPLGGGTIKRNKLLLDSPPFSWEGREAYESEEFLRGSGALLNGPANGAGDFRPRPKSNAAAAGCTAIKSWWKSSAGRISVPAVQGADFKKCCLSSGRYDGSERDYYLRG